MDSSELEQIIRVGFCDEKNRQLCLKFISEVKWSGKEYLCKSKQCIAAKHRKNNFEILIAHQKYPWYSRRCKACKHVETPTANTIFHGGDENILPFFEMVYLITKIQKDRNRRLSNGWIYNKLKDNPNHKGLNKLTIEKYRELIQYCFLDWGVRDVTTKKIFGVIKSYMGSGKSGRWIYILSQLGSRPHIFSKVYKEDNYSSLYNFLPASFIKESKQIILFDWVKKYPSLKKKFPQIQFSDERTELQTSLMEIGKKVKVWLKSINLSYNEGVEFHIKECIGILFQDYSPIQILIWAMQLDLGSK